MKNLGNIALLLAAGAGFVASLPAVDVHAHDIRAYVDNFEHNMLARDPKKEAAGAVTEQGQYIRAQSFNCFHATCTGTGA